MNRNSKEWRLPWLLFSSDRSSKLNLARWEFCSTSNLSKKIKSSLKSNLLSKERFLVFYNIKLKSFFIPFFLNKITSFLHKKILYHIHIHLKWLGIVHFEVWQIPSECKLKDNFRRLVWDIESFEDNRSLWPWWPHNL